MSERLCEIVRFYAPHLNRPSEVMQRDVPLSEAIAHCSLSTTKGADWFDGWRYQEYPRD